MHYSYRLDALHLVKRILKVENVEKEVNRMDREFDEDVLKN